MQFEEIKKEVKEINFDTLRLDCDNHFEAVVVKEELGRLNERLKKFFGEPVWPSKNRLPLRIQETIDGFGGILSGQTLYFSGEGNDTIFAMLWPWQDARRTTLKIIKKI